jgi:hypothetical protein
MIEMNGNKRVNGSNPFAETAVTPVSTFESHLVFILALWSEPKIPMPAIWNCAGALQCSELT